MGRRGARRAVQETDGGSGAQLAPRHDDADLFGGLDGPTALAVPNVSEGEHEPTLDAMAAAVRATGARVLDRHADADHGRAVFTVAADPLTLQDALVTLAAECLDRVDLRRHRGVHPRVGALDVAPIVAMGPADVPLASEIARGLAARIGEELALPVFLYGAVARDPDHARPHDFRRGGIGELRRRMEEGELIPEAGPRRLHPSAGAVLVGVRGPLIAWNVGLPHAHVDHARAIAARVRESGGGLPAVSALGLYLATSGTPQVSMTLEDYRLSSPAMAVAFVRREAERLGVDAGDSELVGLIPGAALRGASPSALRLRGFRPGQVIDAHLPELRR